MDDRAVTGAWGPAVQMERLTRSMEQLTRDVSSLDKKTELLIQRVESLERRFDQMEERTQESPPQSWQAWFLAAVALVAAASLAASWLGGH